jgi:hypothetical protein
MYLSACFRTVRTEFGLELERLLSEGTSLFKDLELFMTDFRESLTFDPDVPAVNYSDRIVSTAETMLAPFRDVFRSSSRTNLASSGQELDDLNRTQVSVTSADSTLRQSFQQILDDCTKEYSELQAVHDRARKSDLKIRTRRRAVFESHLGCEMAQLRQQIESQSLKSLSGVMSEFRGALRPDEEDDSFYAEDSEPTSGGQRVRAAIARLRRTAESSQAGAVSRAQGINRKLRDSRDDLVSMRNELLYAHQRLFQDALFAARNQAPVPVLASGTVPGPVPVQARALPRVAFPESSVEFEAGEVRDPALDRMKQRLRLLREQRDEELQQSASFLQSVHQDEKRRVRAQLNPG